MPNTDRVPERRASGTYIRYSHHLKGKGVQIVSICCAFLHIIALLLLVATFTVCMFAGINTLCKSSEYYADIKDNSRINSNIDETQQLSADNQDEPPTDEIDNPATQEESPTTTLKYDKLEIVLDNRLFTSIAYFAVGLLSIFLFMKHNDFTVK